MKKRLRVSVRALVDHALHSGDLDLESWGPSSPLDAIRAHQILQASRGEGYRKEVTLSHVVEDERFVLEIGGRIDGVVETAEGTVIEEIKTTGGNLEQRAAREEPTHWGQLQVYAYIYALQNDLESVTGRLTYYQLESGETRELERHLERDELEVLFEELVRRYLGWARRMADWLERRNDSIAATPFPFVSYRPGQREMAVQVYRAIAEKGRLLVRAPTGIGKTQATLFASIKALGEGRGDKIFYLTARTTGRGLAEKAVQELHEKGMKLKSVTLTAKAKICFNPDRACNGEECAFARGFYDRIRDAVAELFSHDAFTRERIEAVALAHHVCPFELSLELSLWADLVIGDYNYAFDPRVRLRRVFDDGSSMIFLVDEAHNLVDRARDMYSAELCKRDVLAVRRLAAESLRRSLTGVNRWFVERRKIRDTEPGSWSESAAPEGLYPSLKSFLRQAESFLAAGRENGGTERQAVLDLYFAVWRFLRVAEHYDERFVTCYETTGRDFRVKLFCTDPSRELASTLDETRASIFFSATLSPMTYFRDTLGCGDEARPYVLPSPFPSENLSVLVAEIATTYRKRADTRGRLARLLSTFAGERRGNYLFYFPSYEYMNAVHAACELGGAEVLAQRPDMDEQERADFLERFSEERERTLVGFAVMGGFFGEGIDLVGERLEGAAVIGVGLPGLSPERDRIREWFDEDLGRGFDYAYMFPGMNRVLQAAGRVIRSDTDRGVVLLVDTRFTEPRYLSLLPSEWNPVSVRDDAELRQHLENFWKRSPIIST